MKLQGTSRRRGAAACEPARGAAHEPRARRADASHAARGSRPSRADAAALVESALLSSQRLLSALRAGSGAELLELDLTVTQLRAVFALAEHGPTTVGELGQYLGIGNAAASILVDKVVRLGFATRTEDPEDRRRMIVRLSDRGREVVDVQRLGGERRLREVFSALEPGDLAALARGLGAAAGAAQQIAAHRTAPAPRDRARPPAR